MTNGATPNASLMRASDQDRELAIADLLDACQMGRISTEEYAVRAQAALGATTVGELWGLTWDVPRGVPAAPPALPVPSPGSGWAGPYPPAMWAYPPPRQISHARVNPIAVVAFAVSMVGLFTATYFIGSFLGGVLALLAFHQGDRKEEDIAGHNFATAALAISLSSLVLGIVILEREGADRSQHHPRAAVVGARRLPDAEDQPGGSAPWKTRRVPRREAHRSHGEVKAESESREY